MTTLFAHADTLAWTPTEPGVKRSILVHRPELMLVRVVFEAGAVGYEHHHPHVQASYVESGAFDVTIDGRTERLVAGDAFIVPPNLKHGVTALEAGCLIDAFTPRRDEFLTG